MHAVGDWVKMQKKLLADPFGGFLQFIVFPVAALIHLTNPGLFWLNRLEFLRGMGQRWM